MDALKRFARPLIEAVYQPAMRLKRGQTLGARCVLIDAGGRVLLIRHTYVPGWSFPGGGVEHNETLVQALKRELREEVGVTLEGDPELHGIFANFERFPGDHVARFVSRAWRQDGTPRRNLEIAEQRLFVPGEWPKSLSPATGRRLGELFGDDSLSPYW